MLKKKTRKEGETEWIRGYSLVEPAHTQSDALCMRRSLTLCHACRIDFDFPSFLFHFFSFFLFFFGIKILQWRTIHSELPVPSANWINSVPHQWKAIKEISILILLPPLFPFYGYSVFTISWVEPITFLLKFSVNIIITVLFNFFQFYSHYYM